MEMSNYEQYFLFEFKYFSKKISNKILVKIIEGYYKYARKIRMGLFW
jgi:hypothetical protein